VRIALIGTGGVAIRHLGVLRQITHLDLVAHVSATLSRAEAQASQWGGRAYTDADLASMFDRERPEAVWVCVTPDRHGRLEHMLIERGIPFFLEKPLANDLPTADDIAARLRNHSLVVGVGYKFRALDTLDRVRRLLAQTPVSMLLAAWHDRTPGPAWWRDEARGGGQVVEQATHLVDLARVLAGEPEVLGAVARRVSQSGINVDQVSAALLRFPGGVPGTLTATCLLQGNLAAHVSLVCEGRMLTISERSLRIETGRDTEMVESAVDTFLVEDQRFVQAVREQNPASVLCDYHDALQTHRVCIQIRDVAAAQS
jgi:myo-inositol 2-dehydrogenase / D-chiro-inositol 1-dehydrogenase